MTTSTATQDYPSLKRRLVLLMLRQRLRNFCDRVGLGPSVGERLCCALIVAVCPFVVSFVLAISLHEPAGYATLQGVGAFVLVALFGCLLIGWASDRELEKRHADLSAQLPSARAAWELRHLQARAGVETAEWVPDSTAPGSFSPHSRRCPYCAEDIHPDARKCKHCGEMLAGSKALTRSAVKRQSVHVHVTTKSGGVAAVLEALPGLFQVFGLGHMYAGNIAVGLLIMLTYWAFVLLVPGLVFLLVVIVGFATGGVGLILLPIVLVVWPTVWFIMMIVSPVLAASSVPTR